MRGEGLAPVHEVNQPKLNPEDLMPQLPTNGLRSLSLFSGGGGLDLGFDRAGFQHTASYEVLEDAGKTLKRNRSNWTVFSSDAGDVRNVDWTPYRGQVDVIHGGPPCQPFSVAGRQEGKQDDRDMFPEFVRASSRLCNFTRISRILAVSRCSLYGVRANWKCGSTAVRVSRRSCDRSCVILKKSLERVLATVQHDTL